MSPMEETPPLPATKMDWGHGPNEPVPMWTEDDIREAMCSVMHTMGDTVKIDAVIARLREAAGSYG